jgi:hypothetical protein
MAASWYKGWQLRWRGAMYDRQLERRMITVHCYLWCVEHRITKFPQISGMGKLNTHHIVITISGRFVTRTTEFMMIYSNDVMPRLMVSYPAQECIQVMWLMVEMCVCVLLTFTFLSIGDIMLVKHKKGTYDTLFSRVWVMLLHTYIEWLLAVWDNSLLNYEYYCQNIWLMTPVWMAFHP